MSESDEEFDTQSLKRWKDRFKNKRIRIQAGKGKKNVACTIKETVGSAERAEIKEIFRHAHVCRRNVSSHKQRPGIGDNIDTKRSQRSDSLLVSCPDPSNETDSHDVQSMHTAQYFGVNSAYNYLSGSGDHSGAIMTCGDAGLSIVPATGSVTSNRDLIRGLSMPGLQAMDRGSDFTAAGPSSLVDDDCVSPTLSSFSEESNRTEFESQEHTEDSLEPKLGDCVTAAVVSDHGTSTGCEPEFQSTVMSSEEAGCFHGDTEASSSRTLEGGIHYEDVITISPGSDDEADYKSTEFGSEVNGITRPSSLTNTVSNFHCGTVSGALQLARIPGHSQEFCPCASEKVGNSTFLAPTQAKYSAVRGKSLGGVPSPVKRQLTLLPFLSSSSKKRCVGKNSRRSPSSAASHSPGSASLPASLPNAFVPVVPTWKPASSGSNSRSCPFYKRVPGTNFSVDAFSYGSIPGCSAYFLSHFHSDHYQGITKHFRHPLYCSQATANLVRQQLKVPSECVHPLPMNEPCVIGGVDITLVDANHCPGSVMFLFKLPSGKNYLHTGDFRFCKAMTTHPQLTGCPISQLFLDTTYKSTSPRFIATRAARYCSPRYDFPSQETVIDFAVQKSLAAVKSNPRTLVVCCTYTIGKEKVFLALAEALGSKVCVSREKKAVLECLESDRIARVVSTHPGEASVHVLPISKLSTEVLSVYLGQCPGYTSVLAFRPTGWTHSNKHLSLASIRPKTTGAITIYGIPYSEHSSFSELRQFVQFLRPQRVIATVGGHSAKKREEMQGYFRKWLSPGACNPIARPRQSTLDSTFKKLAN